MDKEYIKNNNKVENIDQSLFEFVQKETAISDHKMDTKRIGYFKDAFIRFTRNKASVLAACIIVFLFLYAIFVPLIFDDAYTLKENDNNKLYYSELLPKVFDNTGFWDGTTKKTALGVNQYTRYEAIGVETGRPAVVEILKEYEEDGAKRYDIRYDTYAGLGVRFITFTKDEYDKIQRFQDENNLQIIYPAVKADGANTGKLEDKEGRVWWQIDSKTNKAIRDSQGNLKNNYLTEGEDDYFSKMRVSSDTEKTFKYAVKAGKSDYKCRVDLYNYFIYLYGEEPSFVFGTNKAGFDIFTRLGRGARLSFIFAFTIATINLVIGAIYGSIAGYFGGTTDLVMERITDVLGNVPFMVVTTLFQLHVAKHVGPIVSLLFAFVATGWIGTASTVRMQFYRYKNQEYILAARTLGAKHSRLMFKHIFPNALGTIITSSVLVIPGVFFSESSLTYLGIVNLESSTVTSIGTMLANGRGTLDTTPHIIFFPALFISLSMITFNLFGNGLRDAFNPSLRGSED